MHTCILTHDTGSYAAQNESRHANVTQSMVLSCGSGWVAAWGVLQVIQLYVQKANNSKLNNMSLVTIPQCWLCVDSHHTTNSPAAVTPTSLDSSVVASVLASLARLGCMEYRVAFQFSCPLFLKLLITRAELAGNAFKNVFSYNV